MLKISHSDYYYNHQIIIYSNKSIRTKNVFGIGKREAFLINIHIV